MQLPRSFTTVTPLSKGLFLALLVALPLWGFFIGAVYIDTMRYVTDVEAESVIAPAKPVDKETAEAVSIRSELDACIDDMQAQISTAKTKYEKGNLLVSFSTTTTFASALKTLDSYSLKAATTTETGENFNAHHWLTVSVPKGEELRWSCILKKDNSVAYTALNQLFELHE